MPALTGPRQESIQGELEQNAAAAPADAASRRPNLPLIMNCGMILRLQLRKRRTRARPTSQLREFAPLGAQARLNELRAEIALVNSIVKELGSGPKVPSSRNVEVATAVRLPGKPRRKMSASARAKIAAAQRKQLGRSEGCGEESEPLT